MLLKYPVLPLDIPCVCGLLLYVFDNLCCDVQFSNGAHSKVPSHLGGISIIVCFMVALVSFGISFAIVPRQVMPWTGLLLVYEWTFALFFLLFGGFLRLIYQWGKTVASQAASLSSHTESFDYDSGKGDVNQYIMVLCIIHVLGRDPTLGSD